MAQLIEMGTSRPLEPSLAYHILRYVPNLVRDEWVNIGVLVFNPRTGERRLRLIEDQVEYNRVRRLHPSVDEAVLRALRDDLEDRLEPEAYCGQVFKQARIWDRLQKSVRVAEFTFPGDPSRLDYSYHRNGTRGFVHTLSVSRAPQDAKSLSYNVRHIAERASYPTEFAAVTDVILSRNNDRHRFVMDTLREVGVEPVPMEGVAVWVAKLQPSLLH